MEEKRISMTYADVLNLHVGDCVGIVGYSELATITSIFETVIKTADCSRSFSRTMEVEIIYDLDLIGREHGPERFSFCFDYDTSKKNEMICKFLKKIIYE